MLVAHWLYLASGAMELCGPFLLGMKVRESIMFSALSLAEVTRQAQSSSTNRVSEAPTRLLSALTSIPDLAVELGGKGVTSITSLPSHAVDLAKRSAIVVSSLPEQSVSKGAVDAAAAVAAAAEGVADWISQQEIQLQPADDTQLAHHWRGHMKRDSDQNAAEQGVRSEEGREHAE